MRTQFPLFMSHLDLAHSYWTKILKPGDKALDATCGAGFDSEKLASFNLNTLYIFDIQKEAIERTKLRLGQNLQNVKFYEMCHSKIAEVIEKDSLKLIVYNLGYLPKSDKSIKTLPDTTLKSLEGALSLLQNGGVISITCYPGHLEGALEEKELLHFCKALSPKEWSVCFHQFPNRQLAPSLILIQKTTAVSMDVAGSSPLKKSTGEGASPT